MGTKILLIGLILAVILFSGCTQQPGNNYGQPFGENPTGGQNNPGNNPGTPPGNQGAQPGQSLPPVNSNAPLPALPDNFPESRLVSKKLGSVEINYFSTTIARGLTESGTDFFINLKNTGSTKESICFSSITNDFKKAIPSWNLHFFSMQDSPVEVSPGEEKKLWYFASVDAEGFFTINFKLWNCARETESIELPVVFGSNNERFWGKETSYISGTVKDSDGNPVQNAEVSAVMNCGRVNFRGTSDSSGNYSAPVLAMEDINAIYLGKELACDSADYFVGVEQQGYEYYYKSNIAPTRKNPARLDIALKKKQAGPDYSLEWEKNVSDNFGFFWVKPSSDWDFFAATQAKHPPELNKPANFYLFDSQGNILWKQPTGNECWGIAIAKDASKIAAGCHDGKVYLVGKTGKLLWTSDFGTMVRSACISNNGSKVLSGDVPTLLDSATGTKQDLAWKGDWLRNCAFYQDDSGFVAGAREVTGFDFSGKQEWRQIIGEFPLLLAVDSAKNTFAAGKSRTLFSFDSKGELRWKHRIPDHVITAGAATQDGSRIALGTVGGMAYLFDNAGNLLWKRGIGSKGPATSVGHNAVAISEDGKIILVGTAPQNCVVAFNESGTKIWENCISPDESNKDLLLGVTNVQISGDKKQIIASYGDNFIRKFSVQ